MNNEGKMKVPARTAPVLFEEETASTNTRLRETASQLPHGTVLWSLRQTAGKGRSGRSFSSPEGGLYFSMLLRYPEPDERLTAVTPLAAVAVERSLRTVCGIEPEIKWPNDLLLNGKKLCGILTESVTGTGGMQIIVGIGINVNTERFPDPVSGIAGSVFTETGKTADISELAGVLVRELDRTYAKLPLFAPEDLAEYRARCGTIGRRISSGGTAVRIEEDFSLITALPDGTERKIRFGEIFQE